MRSQWLIFHVPESRRGVSGIRVRIVATGRYGRRIRHVSRIGRDLYWSRTRCWLALGGFVSRARSNEDVARGSGRDETTYVSRAVGGFAASASEDARGARKIC